MAEQEIGHRSFIIEHNGILYRYIEKIIQIGYSEPSEIIDLSEDDTSNDEAQPMTPPIEDVNTQFNPGNDKRCRSISTSTISDWSPSQSPPLLLSPDPNSSSLPLPPPEWYSTDFLSNIDVHLLSSVYTHQGAHPASNEHPMPGENVTNNHDIDLS